MTSYHAPHMAPTFLQGYQRQESKVAPSFPEALAALCVTHPRCKDTGPHQAVMRVILASKLHAPYTLTYPVTTPWA